MSKRKGQTQAERFKIALWQTWEAIAPDLMHAIKEESGKSEMPREDVIEVVLDANYLDSYGGLDKGDLADWNALSYEACEDIAGEVFTYQLYE